ncbi:hypothetical protein NIES4072_31610 [Nostoc commune NIES-4072]|uniref:Uncharacterized protein n=1 Tax=Nostoc commune NIES-4072 TaxID=2005467 RepID=A0A2R5FTF6_NOSCO|nr:hypothetical protein NIES4070_59150 [Nostoc commune HK-02]GBG19493.1 hypothetical protein NIES4072_31610 [Nostoc commune NIES-4072]
MPHFSINISNIVITNKEYRKLRAYAEYRQISIHEAIRLLIDSLPECSPNNKLSRSHSFMFPRRFLHISFDNR